MQHEEEDAAGLVRTELSGALLRSVARLEGSPPCLNGRSFKSGVC